MNNKTTKTMIILAIIIIGGFQTAFAGPPFNTDDPQPVDFKHWEYYISSIHTLESGELSGMLPLFEVNYGLVPNLQVHLVLPINYNAAPNQYIKFGYSYTEFGVKYRFLQETDNIPQIGVFPIVEIPTVNNPAFGDGNVQIFIPVWIQKTWDKLTTYGGGGYWIRPGIDNKNSVFLGWEMQYDVSPVVTLGGELYYHSPETVGSNSVAAFNVGGIINISDKTHFIFSVGHSLVNDNFTSSYIGFLWTI